MSATGAGRRGCCCRRGDGVGLGGTLNADTIFAVASGSGRAAVAIMRVSGAGCAGIVERLCGAALVPRCACVRTLRGAGGELLDRALVLWFPRPRSFTGEDCVEFHIHGGAAVRDGVAGALVALSARPAEAGEFSRRAFLNGKMDLLAAEAAADLVEAETSAQRVQALRQMGGALGDQYRGWSARLLRLLAQQEALIDFPDEDLPIGVDDAVNGEIAALAGEMKRHLQDGGRGERLREGLVFAIVGPPNVGKSSLMNAISERKVAIVAKTAGTTRDVLEARIVLGGVPVTLLDTAGLRDTDDPIEAEGVRLARERAGMADLVINVADASLPDGGALVVGIDVSPGVERLQIYNKIDQASPGIIAFLAISALTGQGMAALRDHLADIARRLTSRSGPPPLTRARHRAAVGEALACVTAAANAPLAELRGEDLRLAMRSLGRLTGEVGVEDILDSVFGQFCIGK